MTQNYQSGDRVVVNQTQVGTIRYWNPDDDLFVYEIHHGGGVNTVTANISLSDVEPAEGKSAEDIGHFEAPDVTDPVTNTPAEEDDPERVERQLPLFPDTGYEQQTTARHKNFHVADTSVFDDENSDGLKVDDESATGSDD